MKRLIILAALCLLPKFALAELISGTVGNNSFSGTINVNNVTNNYTLTSSSTLILASAPVTGMTITLPAASANNGKVFNISKVDKSSGTVTIQVVGTDLISGTGTVKLNAFTQSASIISDGVSNWLPWGQGIQWTPAFTGPGVGDGTTPTAINTSSAAYCSAFTTEVPVLIDSMTVQVHTSSTTAAMGITFDAGVYDILGNRLASTGGYTGAMGFGRNNIALSSAVNLPPGEYWMCMQSSVATFPAFAGSSQNGTMSAGTQLCLNSTSTLPATMTFPCSGSRLSRLGIIAHVVGGAL